MDRIVEPRQFVHNYVSVFKSGPEDPKNMGECECENLVVHVILEVATKTMQPSALHIV